MGIIYLFIIFKLFFPAFSLLSLGHPVCLQHRGNDARGVPMALL